MDLYSLHAYYTFFVYESLLSMKNIVITVIVTISRKKTRITHFSQRLNDIIGHSNFHSFMELVSVSYVNT